MAIEALEANITLSGGRLFPRASDCTEKLGRPPRITTETVSILVGTDQEAVDVLQDWESDVPAHYKPIGLTVKQRKKLQRQRLFLRNRRIVSGYELLDRQLRAKLGDGDPDAVPPTWLTVGKWTAKTIGDLLDGSIPISRRRRRARRRVVRLFLRLASRWRTLAMSRVLILGNREIFAQVASALVIFTETNFEKLNLDFPEFVGEYGECLLGRGNPYVADELLFPISATTRDPLSDSMLRALYSYYKAIDVSSERERTTCVVTGNLHLAAYEQHVAQTFLDLGLRLRSGRALRKLLAGFKPLDATRAGPVRNRPLDMLMEDMFGIRLMDLFAAAFASNYILSVQVGSAHEHDVESGQVFAPTDPLGQVEDAVKSLMALVDEDESESKAGESLRHIWVALDRADGHPDRCRVRDWRNYNSRISYIANLFAVSAHDPMLFGQPALSEDELRNFLAGQLINEDGIELTPKQREAARVVLENAKEPPSDLAAAAAE